jgi:methylase of polypeptide subunit release factors
MLSLAELAGLALACGAGDVGGPLSKAELALLKRATPPSARAVQRTRRAIRDGEDPLGVAFLELRPAIERRAMGAFYTGTTIVESMLKWALAHDPERLVDPGCGSGRFSVAAVCQRPQLEVVAVDLDPLATLLTRAALSAVRARRATVIQGDYLSIEIARSAGRTAFLGNPPYVRHHDLSAETKALAAALAAKVGHRVSGLAGLHALFYLATLAKHGSVGDVGSFVTSSEWLDVGYGSVIRDMFTNGLGGRSLLVFDAVSIPFADAMTTAAITTFRIGDEARFARIGRATSAHKALRLERRGRSVERETLGRAKRWSPMLREFDEAFAGDTIGTLFRVSRGQVTGSNTFFTMTRAEADRYEISEFCVPLVTSADEVFKSNGILRDTPDRRVGLVIPRNLDLARHSALAKYIRTGEASGVHRGYVASHRKPWYSLTFPRPPIVATYMARQAPVFARNPDGLGLLNVAHGLHPRAPIDDRTLSLLVEQLNATRSTFVGRGRTYHGGLEKFEPGEMEALPLAGHV